MDENGLVSEIFGTRKMARLGVGYLNLYKWSGRVLNISVKKNQGIDLKKRHFIF